MFPVTQPRGAIPDSSLLFMLYPTSYPRANPAHDIQVGSLPTTSTTPKGTSRCHLSLNHATASYSAPLTLPYYGLSPHSGHKGLLNHRADHVAPMLKTLPTSSTGHFKVLPVPVRPCGIMPHYFFHLPSHHSPSLVHSTPTSYLLWLCAYLRAFVPAVITLLLPDLCMADSLTSLRSLFYGHLTGVASYPSSQGTTPPLPLSLVAPP